MDESMNASGTPGRGHRHTTFRAGRREPARGGRSGRPPRACRPSGGDDGAHAGGGARSRLALVAPAPRHAALRRRTDELAARLTDAGHDVVVVAWRGHDPGDTPYAPRGFRVVPALVAARPDTWFGAGRRLADRDAVVVVHADAATVPAGLAILAGAGGRDDHRPTTIVLDARGDERDGPMTRRLLARADRVWPADSAVPWEQAVTVPAPLAPELAADAPPPRPRPRRARALSRRLRGRVPRLLRRGPVPPPEPTRHGASVLGEVLPADLLATDVLLDRAAARAARAWAAVWAPTRSDATSAWAAQGALAALRLVDGGDRECVVVDQSGPRSPLAGWMRHFGFDVHAAEVGGPRASVAALDVAAASVDLLTQVHPADSGPGDVDALLSDAAWALADRGIVVVTLPLDDGTDPFGAAEMRALLARADDLGLRLVGDPDAELLARLREGALEAEGEGAYGLLRLAFRRRR